MNHLVRATRDALLASLACAALAACESDSRDIATWNSCTGRTARCSTAACGPDSVEEITLERARELGFSVDPVLSLFSEEQHEIGFHFGNVDSCSDEPSTDGQVRVHVRFARLLLQKQKAVAGAACESRLVYRGLTELDADGGLLSGAFESDWEATEDGIVTSVDLTPDAFAGSLGIQVDTGRAHEAKVHVSLTVRKDVLQGGVHTTVRYLNGDGPAHDFGEGFLWPADQASSLCNWLNTEPSDAPLLTIDEYNARP